MMKAFHTNRHNQTVSLYHLRFMSLVVLSAVLTFAFVLRSSSGKQIALANTTQIAHTSASAARYPVKVFFSTYPDSVNTNASIVSAVDRTSPTPAVGTFALQLLIAGPTPQEKQAGLFTELNTLLSGPSACAAPLPIGGPDFTLTLDKKGTVTEAGTATLKFCRTISSPGVGADARVTAEVNATLKQFSAIKKVVILTKEGHCFGDGSGRDVCLK